MAYTWKSIVLDDHRYLSPLKELFCLPAVQALVDEDSDMSRQSFDGIITVRGMIGGRLVGAVLNDFRVNGGSYSKENTRRLQSFFETAMVLKTPVVMVFNTLGVRIMEGRTVFIDAFRLLPIISKFRESGLLITCMSGRCLGLGALLFGMGHYRIAAGNEGPLNLTGPEVMKLFFGEKFDLNALASPQWHFDRNDLIHEIAPNRASALGRARSLFALSSGHRDPREIAGEHFVPGPVRDSDSLHQLIRLAGETAIEIFPQMSKVVRAYLVQNGSRMLGLLVNPPGNVNNLITVEALRKYSAALDLFQALGLPVISMVDTPGADPRMPQSDRNIISALIQTTQKIVQYRYPKMGIVVGRCFGGATVLSFPKIFGGLKHLALEGCTVGIMHESIITQVLSGSQRLTDEWKKVATAQTADLADLMATGEIDGIRTRSEMKAEINDFLGIMKRKTFSVEEPVHLRSRPREAST